MGNIAQARMEGTVEVPQVSILIDLFDVGPKGEVIPLDAETVHKIITLLETSADDVCGYSISGIKLGTTTMEDRIER